MRTCRTCQQDKEESEFQKHSAASDGLNTQCKACVSEYRKQWRKDNPSKHRQYKEVYRAKHGDRIKESEAEYRKQNKELLAKKIRDARKQRKIELVNLMGGKCMRCGYSKCYAALQFHHRDPKTKKFDIARQLCNSVDLSEAIEESKKCDLLCANCHFEEHCD